MNTKYCPHCGKRNDFINGVAPKTCKSCNKSFAEAFKVEASEDSIKKITRPKKKIIAQEIEDFEEEDNEEETFAGEIIVPRKFEVQINIPKRTTIRDLSEGGNVQGGVNPNLGSADFE